MFAGTASGELLPPYIIYKSKNLWQSWCEGGPEGTQFGRSNNGWMHTPNFIRWFDSIVVPWARRKPGKKVLIGDDLSSHLSTDVVDKSKDLGISFVLLPPNSTDKCQPLDVAFFGPQKREWRKILEAYKMKHPSSTSLDKSVFPSLLKQLVQNMELRNQHNLIAGFQACGICPYDPREVLKKLPAASVTSSDSEADNDATSSHGPKLSLPKYHISEALLLLQQFKYTLRSGTHDKPPSQPRRKLAVEPGKSVSAEQLHPESSSTSKPMEVDVPESEHESEIESMNGDEQMSVDMPGVESVSVDDFVLCEFSGKRMPYYYVGIDTKPEDDEGDVEVEFLRKSEKVDGKFVQRKNQDCASFELKNMKIILTRVEPTGTTRRLQGGYFFKQSLKNLDIR